MRFLIDMPLSPKIAVFLNSLGHEAVHLFPLGKKRATDEEIVQMAQQENRIILSTDLDFGAILAHSLKVIPGVILFRVEYASTEKISRLLKELFARFKQENLINVIVVVEETRIRVRKLPIL